jgi:hypothetical protein
MPIQDLKAWAHDLDMVVVMLEDPQKKKLASLVCLINKSAIACPDDNWEMFFMKNMKDKRSITTLVLGCDQGKGLQRCGPIMKPGNHISCSRECKKVREWTPTLPNEFPFWKLESRWTLESSKGNFKGQNSLD